MTTEELKKLININNDNLYINNDKLYKDTYNKDTYIAPITWATEDYNDYTAPIPITWATEDFNDVDIAPITWATSSDKYYFYDKPSSFESPPMVSADAAADSKEEKSNSFKVDLDFFEE